MLYLKITGGGVVVTDRGHGGEQEGDKDEGKAGSCFHVGFRCGTRRETFTAIVIKIVLRHFIKGLIA